MLIVVQYTDESYDMIIDYHLDELLNSGKIKGFSSQKGWVKVAATPGSSERKGYGRESLRKAQ